LLSENDNQLLDEDVETAIRTLESQEWREVVKKALEVTSQIELSINNFKI